MCILTVPGETSGVVSQGSQSSARYLNPASPKYEAGVFSTRL
jgi:hypothetical protein